jgi:hypothetical protein
MMGTNHRAELARIKRFDQLVRYLRDEMGWPISSDDFEEITFDYTAEELGINAEHSAKIQEIRRLRPLVPQQPWGIFFIKFEPKRLPVVALRRILGQVVIRKRSSAISSDLQAWKADDLLFISNHGSGDERQITFAHFAKEPELGELPTLRVLGWDGQDTALHLDAVASELTTSLAWPSDPNDLNRWTTQWAGAFKLRHREVITTSRDLSIRLAALAKSIRARIITGLSIETSSGALSRLLAAFRVALLHDLDEAGFADMYAQTIAYGLLSARISNPLHRTADDFASHMRTNPFLRELLEAFIHAGGRKGSKSTPGLDFDELGVADVVALLDNSNMEAVIRDFGNSNPDEDPVIHFYEQFLHQYDPVRRMDRGVFYTPRPVVSYIVRSIHELLKSEFGLEDGLADVSAWSEVCSRIPQLNLPRDVQPDQPFVQILDPAAGTGTFLVEVIEVIHATLKERWRKLRKSEDDQAALWNEYVPRYLLPRMHGYELMMAPYAIAHLKIGLKLYETGYRFASNERARIYLTNALEGPHDFSSRLDFAIPALGHEAEAVNHVKGNQRFTVVLGNPPYANSSQNRSPWINDLLSTYTTGLGERRAHLGDDYVKFYRLFEHAIQRSGQGLIGLITASSYLDGATHRLMRKSLLETFQKISIVNLHGNARRQERTPEGGRDENVFAIMQGVTVAFGVRRTARAPQVTYADLWGLRNNKHAHLSSGEIDFQIIEPAPEAFRFIKSDPIQAAIYAGFPSLTQIFLLNGSGIQTKRDAVAIRSTKSFLLAIVDELKSLSTTNFAAKHGIPETSASWSVDAARRDVETNPGQPIPILVRPFDRRWTYYTAQTNGFLARPRKDTTRHLLADNLALIAKRQTKEDEFSSVWVVSSPINEGFFSIDPRGRESIFPLKLLPETDQRATRDLELGFTSNINRDHIPNIFRSCSDEELFAYIYAILNSTEYRTRYAELLKSEFPRIPFPRSQLLLKHVAALGAILVDLHAERTPPPSTSLRSSFGVPPIEVKRPRFENDSIYINARDVIRPVPEAVWNFRVGGYLLCKKWLEGRSDVGLTAEEIGAFINLLNSISETLRIIIEIDKVIPTGDSWDREFAAGEFRANS